MNNVTLIINVSVGDSGYADLSIRNLIAKHLSVKKKILIIDSIKDKKKDYCNTFETRLNEVTKIAGNLLNENLLTQVVFTHFYNNYKTIFKKFLGSIIPAKAKYDYRGAPYTAYLIGFELTKTKYQLRYDCDMLLYQKKGTDWINYAIQKMENDEGIICASPRTHPLLNLNSSEDEKFCWFSTRCSLFDMEKLSNINIGYSLKVYFEIFIRKILNKSYPLAFESLISKMMLKNKLSCLYLNNHPAYLLHPEIKNKAYVKNLAHIIKFMELNKLPLEQYGKENVQLVEWIKYINNNVQQA